MNTYRFALRVSPGTQKYVVIDIPQSYGKLALYKTSLGHKGLTSFLTFNGIFRCSLIH